MPHLDQPEFAPQWQVFAPDGRWLQVDIARQILCIAEQAAFVACYPVSTALNGVGEQEGSGQTPSGWHLIRAKIGAEHPANAVFRGRRWTGECYTEQLASDNPQRDWILGRILWLSGLEPGHNRGGHCDTMRRYIYLHGTPDSEPMGEARSHGCIRMRMQDISLLFTRVSPYLPVYIG